MKLSFLGFLISSLLLVGASQAQAQAYTFTDLGGEMSTAFGINDIGQIVGQSTVPGGQGAHAVLWQGASMIDLGTLGGASSAAYGINNAGQIAGQAQTALGVMHAVSWNGAVKTDLTAQSGGYRGQAFSINNNGRVLGLNDGHTAVWDGAAMTVLRSDVIGNAINDAGQVAARLLELNHAVLLNADGSTSRDLSQLDYSKGSAIGINNAGDVVGVSNGHATLWRTNGTIDLRPIAGVASEPHAINSAGQVVGASSFADPFSGVHATLWIGTAVIDLNATLDAETVDAGWVLQEALDINEKGWIVGYANNPKLGIFSHAFLLTPVPEPHTCVLFLFGLGGLACVQRRRAA